MTNPRWLHYALITLAGMSIAMELALSFNVYKPLMDEFGAYTDGLRHGGKWLSQQVSPEESVAVVDAGA